MSLKKNLLYNFFLSLSQAAFPLLSIPYISRVLDPAGIGTVTFFDSFTYYFIVIAEFGIVTYGIREVARKRENPLELSKLVSELISLHILTSMASLFIYLVCIFFLRHKISDYRLLLFSVSFILVNSFACEWYFWGKERFKYIAIRSLITRSLGLVSIFLLIHDPSDYLIYYAIIVGAAILNLIWNFFRLFGEIRPTFKNIGWKKHLPVLLTTYRISLVYSVVLMLDNVFLRIVSTSAAVAYYAFGVKVLRIAGALVTDVLLVLYPRTVSMVSQERMDDVQRTISQTSQLIFLATIPMGVGIFLTAEPLTFSYFGRNFEPVIENLKILCFYPLIKSTGLFLNKQLLMPFDRERQVLRSLEISVIIFVCLAIPLSYQYADKGMSVAVIVSEVAVVALNYYFARKLKLNLRLIDWESAAHAFFGTLLFFPVTWAINSSIDNMLTKLIVQVISCIFVYLLFLVFIIRNTLVISCLQSCKDAIILSKRAKNETR